MSAVVRFRVDNDDKLTLLRAAKAKRLTLSGYLRLVAFDAAEQILDGPDCPARAM